MKHKSGLMGFSYLGGLICALFINIAAAFVLAVMLLTAAVILSLLRKNKNAALIMFTFSAALSVCSIYTLLCYSPLIELSGETREISGTLTDIRRYTGDKAAYTVKTSIDGIQTEITMFFDDLDCKIGDEVEFTAKLTELTDNTNFAEKSYYRSKGIFLKAQSIKNFSVTKREDINIRALITDFSNRISDRTERYLPGEEGALLKAVFMGDKTGLTASLSDNIKRCGISHFTAVSGLHLTVISHILMLILSLAPIGKNRKVKFGLLTALILVFMVFFNMSMSVIRAGIMLIIFYGAEVFMRKGDPLSSMGIAILIITMFQPYACADIGFLLSLSGTAGVAVIAPYFCERLKRTSLFGIKSATLSTLCATLTTFPLSCIFFGGFSPAGILVNLLIYPFFFTALICMVPFMLTGGSAPGFLLPAGIMAKAMIFIIDLVGSFKYSYVAFNDNTLSLICVLSVLFIALIYFVFKSRRKTAIAVILSFSVLIASGGFLRLQESGKAKLILYSDGDYPCVIIENESEQVVCAGSDSPDIAEYITEYIENGFLDRINTLVILNTNHNYLEDFKKIPCDKLILPDKDTEEDENNSESIAVIKREASAVINVKGTSISVSPAKEPVCEDVNIIYGYKKNFPKLNGVVMFSDNRMSEEDYYGLNFYFENYKLYITDKGLEVLKG